MAVITIAVGGWVRRRAAGRPCPPRCRRGAAQAQQFAMAPKTDNPGGMAANATVQQLRRAVATGSALVVDVRSVEENAKGPSVPGAINLVWDREASTMPTTGLPADTSVPLLVH